jgi:nitric oxide reductase activation protein
MSVLLLIDGSGSMYGERRNSAMISSVILHEVLKKQGIEHAIVEHRGQFEEPEIDVNILVDFNSREEEKYNIMQLTAEGDNRDGLALYWAEKYINQRTFCENKLIIVLSDGQPAHDYDCYYGAAANKDTANAVKKIMNRGTNIIAVALDNDGTELPEDSTFNDLKEIYPHIIQCKDLKRLTGQILNIVSKQLI